MRARFLRASDGADTVLYVRNEPRQNAPLPKADAGFAQAAVRSFKRSIGTVPKIAEGVVPFPTPEWVAGQSLLSVNNALCPGSVCTLHGARKVYFRGSPRASIAVIGEAPGQEEDACGVPFVGRSGRLLEELLSRAGFRQDYIVTNTVLCRPPGNRDPERREKVCCLPRLLAFLEKVKPKGVVCVGAHAAETFFPIAAPQKGEANLPVNCLRTLDLGAMRFLHIRHPAYILRKGGLNSKDKVTKELVEDTVFTLNLFLDQIKRTRVPKSKTWLWTPHLPKLMEREYRRGEDLLVAAEETE